MAGAVSEIPRGWENSVGQVNGDLDLLPICACRLRWGRRRRRRLDKGTMVLASTIVLEGAAPPVLALKPDNSVPPRRVGMSVCPRGST